VTQPADAEDGHQVRGAGTRHLHGLVGGDAGAGQGAASNGFIPLGTLPT
jgi:hypothetical protein